MLVLFESVLEAESSLVVPDLYLCIVSSRDYVWL